MQLFDSHCHLNDKAFEKDVMDVIKRAHAAGVTHMMVAGIDRKTSLFGVKLAEAVKGIYASVGVHPHDASECSDAVINFLTDVAASEKVKAWGEIGLDFNRMYSPRLVQEKWMEKQLEAADKLDLPVIFHERDSKGRFLEMLKASGKPVRDGVVHCFSGSTKELYAYLDMGLYIGITGIITMTERGKSLNEQITHIPTERLLIETDAPYLTPKPENKSFKRNEPAFVKSVMMRIAEALKKDFEPLAAEVFENTRRVFRIP